MKVFVLEECGYRYALYGIGLSYGLTSNKECKIVDDQALWEKLDKIAHKLAHIGGGENKFLRQMQVWLTIQAPRYWWSEFDTYKVGTTAQSESTMHTLHKNKITLDMFEGFCDSQRHNEIVKELEYLRSLYENLRNKNIWRQLKQELPEAFLQARVVNLNYAVLQNMYNQRHNHGLNEWHIFLENVLNQVQYPYFIRRENG